MNLRTTENDLIRAVEAALTHMPDVLVVNIRNEATRGRRKVARKGTPDFLGLVMVRSMLGKSRPLAIETKASHRDHCNCDTCCAQRVFRQDWEDHGGLYVFGRSVQAVLDGIFGRRAA